ncbi:MAG TPA: LysR family transcriptional regulator [Desulfobacterales bacterium]|nr:LysR family transcriptional regulator [Desulfobacterales bacterium]
MNLNQLKIFYLSSKLGSLSAAGRELNITQPAVTKGIQRLQNYYEIKLVNRFGKKMALTDAGEVLYGIAEKIFEMEKQAEESICDFQRQRRGYIQIHASESFGAYYLPNIINPFVKMNPNIHVLASILPTEQVISNTANLENDIGFISYPVENKKLMIREVIEDRLEIITPPGHPLARNSSIEPCDLEGRSIIMHEKGSATAMMFEKYMQKNDLSIHIPLEFSSNRAIKLAVEDGIGIGITSHRISKDEIEAGKLSAIPFSDRSMKHKYYLVHHKDKYLSETLQRLIQTADEWSAEYTESLSDR